MSSGVPPDTTLVLIEAAKRGNPDALEQLAIRYLPRLQRWASGRLPQWARGLAETQDLVQETVIRAFRNIEGFEHRGEGALQAYLRHALLNRIREEIRRAGRRPASTELDPSHPDDGASPLERAIGRQGIERYERALTLLSPLDREAIVMRIELGCSFEEVAVGIGKPNANAARSAVNRALVRLLQEMRDGHTA